MRGHIGDIIARTSKIAFHFLDGPRSLIPRTGRDSSGWLEPVFRARSYPIGRNKVTGSWSVFVDNTMNRTSGFLKPVLRSAIWNRPADIVEIRRRKIAKQPTVKIFHHKLSAAEAEWVNLLLRRVDAEVSKISFLRTGLITDRRPPKGTKGIGFRDWQVTRENGAQSIEFDMGMANDRNLGLEIASKRLAEYIELLCKTAPSKPHTERYNNDVTSMDSNPFHWDYLPTD